MEQEQDGSCDFVAIEEPQIALYDIDQTKMDNDNERITTFIKTLLEYSEIKFYSEENFIIEALTFILLTCNINITDRFQLLYYQLQNNYVPWGFSAPKNKDARNLDSVEVFNSLINIMLRLDVNRKVLQCHHCKSKCSCEVVATFSISEIELFTMQDPIHQAAEPPPAVNNEETPDNTTVEASITNAITMRSESFIIDFECNLQECGSQESLSSQTNSVPNGNNVDARRTNSEEATLSSSYDIPQQKNYDAWKGHNDEGIPIINFDAMFGHSEHDPDLQLNCKV